MKIICLVFVLLAVLVFGTMAQQERCMNKSLDQDAIKTKLAHCGKKAEGERGDEAAQTKANCVSKAMEWTDEDGKVTDKAAFIKNVAPLFMAEFLSEITAAVDGCWKPSIELNVMEPCFSKAINKKCPEFLEKTKGAGGSE